MEDMEAIGALVHMHWNARSWTGGLRNLTRLTRWTSWSVIGVPIWVRVGRTVLVYSGYLLTRAWFTSNKLGDKPTWVATRSNRR